MFNLSGLFKRKTMKECQEISELLNSSSATEEESKENLKLKDMENTVDLEKKDVLNQNTSFATWFFRCLELSFYLLVQNSFSDIGLTSTPKIAPANNLSAASTSQNNQGRFAMQEKMKPSRRSPTPPSLSTAHNLLEDQKSWHLLEEYVKRQKQLEEKNQKLSNQLAELVLEVKKDKEEISKQAEQLKNLHQFMKTKETQKQNTVCNGVNGLNRPLPKSQAHLVKDVSSDNS